jgi:high-affinity iron transporter
MMSREATGRVIAALFTVCLLAAAAPARGDDDLASLQSSLEAARGTYATDPGRAREIAGDAFLRFESSGLDRTLAARDPSAYRDLEAAWLRAVTSMRDGASPAEIDAQLRAVSSKLDAAEPRRSSFGALFANAALIILREGFEAMLILSAVAATLRASGARAGLRALGFGASAAVAASLLLAAVAEAIGGLAFDSEALEGITCLVAVVVLFLTSYWLISRVEGQRWQHFIRERVKLAAAEDRRAGLFLLAFVVVFREGFETVLFYGALAGEGAHTAGGPMAIGSGLALGTALLALLYVAINRFGVRIPMRQFFAVTGGMLYLLAIKFAGVGIRELQEAGWLSPRPLGWMPDNAWLRDWLGVFADAQTLAAQGVLVAAVLLGLWISRSGSGGAANVAGAAGRAA